MNTRSVSLLVAAAGLCAAAHAGPFTAGNLVVMRVSKANVGGAGSIVLAEHAKTGAFTGNTVVLPDCGIDALTMADLTNHDRHIHRSTDGRFLAVACYNFLPGGTDPSGEAAANAPRAVALVKFDGSADFSTRLTDSYDATSVRGAFTTDGTSIWIGGDNASGATATGGLRYTTRGSSTSTDLSQVQVQGGPKTPDNIRDVNVFAGQLYDCSGSDSSVGKGVFIVGSGLPTSGSQTLSPKLNGNDGASTSSFYLLDLNPSEPGPDVLYTATSAAGDGVHKYVKSGGVWTAKGTTLFPGIEQVVAEPSGGSVIIYAASPSGVAKLTDATPLTGTLSGNVTSFLISATADYSIGGIDFTPAATCAGPAISEAPADASGCASVGSPFSVTVPGPGPYTYQWQLETAPGTWITLTSCPQSIGCDDGFAYATPADSATSAIRVRPCNLQGTSYRVRCIVGNDCGYTVSAPATYTVCPADFDCNTFVNGDDFDTFIILFEAGDSGADYDNNTFVNGDDFDQFVIAFEAGC